MSPGPEDPDWELVGRLRAGDERAFAELAEKYQGTMLSLARGYVPSRAVAEEVVQDAWLGVLRGVHGFRWRSSFRTWLFRILAEDQMIAAKLAARIMTAIDELPLRQREVVTLRDVQGLSSEEVCAILAISHANQRVLLHRGRGRLRQVIGSELGGCQ